MNFKKHELKFAIMKKLVVFLTLMLIVALFSNGVYESSATPNSELSSDTTDLVKEDTVWVDFKTGMVDSLRNIKAELDRTAHITRTEYQILYTGVKGTVYHPVADQTDDTPFITADNSKIDPKRVNQLRWVAISKDMMDRQFVGRDGKRHNWTGHIKLGDTIWVDYDKQSLWREAKECQAKYEALKTRYERIKGMWVVHDITASAFPMRTKEGVPILDENGIQKIMKITQTIDFLQSPVGGVFDSWKRNLIIAKVKKSQITSATTYTYR